MQTISLPIVSRTSSLRNALVKMKKHQRSGLVVRKGPDFLLYTATEIRAGLSDELTSLADLKPKYKSITFGSESRSKSPESSSKTRSSSRSLATTSGRRFLLVSASSSHATIAVPKQKFLVTLRASPSHCHCLGPRHHDEFPGSVQTGDDCPHCGKKITCED
jgi:hypothetical protein